MKFREVIYATQVVDSTMTRTQLMRSKSALTQTITAFMSEPSVTYNMVADVFHEWNQDGKQGYSRGIRKYGRKFTKVAGIYATQALAAAVIRAFTDILRDDDEDKENDEEYLENLWANLINEINPLSKLPLLKDVVSMLQGFEPTRLDEQAIMTAVRAGEKWVKVFEGEREVDYEVVYKTLQGISQMSGLPISNAFRDVIAMWNGFIGSIYPSLKVDTD